ncbi:hypothetical protein SLS53_000237 [Cytospora paraplurivora]|uniref:Rhodopsin domain-containing protein n=1 Tax=Cytospora paraplurivora TaxID=2898453 RepID=A0AAN9YPM8_9PEZI
MSSLDNSDVDSDAMSSHQKNIVVCAVVTWSIAAIFVGLRLNLRGRLIRVIGPEDWVILAALIFSGCNSAGSVVEACYGMGRHSKNVPDKHWRPMLEAAWFTALFFSLSICLTKVSILLLYLRSLTYEWTKISLWILMAVVVVTGLADIGIVATTCLPLHAFWDETTHAAYCHPREVYYAIAGLQIGTDFLIFLLPLPVVWSMRSPRDQKAVLITVFSFGFFICIVSVVRLVELAANDGDKDYTFTGVTVAYWSLIEVNTAIVVSCIMTFKPLLTRVLASSARQKSRTQVPPAEHSDAAQSIRPPTIGSEPTRGRGVVARKQSWLSVQLARMDRSLQTVNETGETETRGTSDELDTGTVGAGMGLWGADVHKQLTPPPPPLAVVPDRRSYGSSVTMPVDENEGPQE